MERHNSTNLLTEESEVEILNLWQTTAPLEKSMPKLLLTVTKSQFCLLRKLPTMFPNLSTSWKIS